MFRKMLSARQREQVRRIVVQRIAIDMMNELPTWQRSVCAFPLDDGSQSPDIWLSDFNPSTRQVVAVLALSNSYGANGFVVDGRLSGLELRRWR